MTNTTQSNDRIEEILTYLVDNVQMIKARMVRGDIIVDEGKAHNRRLKIEAHKVIEQLLLEREIKTWKEIRRSYPRKQTMQGRVSSRLNLADVDRKITELNQTKEK